METSTIIYSITISWMFLAYSVNISYLKELLYLIVTAHLLTLSYVALGSLDFTNIAKQIEMMEIYLSFNLIAGIGFIMFYLLAWTISYLKIKKNKDSNRFKG